MDLQDFHCIDKNMLDHMESTSYFYLRVNPSRPHLTLVTALKTYRGTFFK